MEGFFILLFLVIGIGLIFVWRGIQAEKARRESLRIWAKSKGFTYSDNKDRGIPRTYEALDVLRAGDDRYCFNTMRGSIGDLPLLITDHHYETHSTDSKGNRQTHHHYFTLFVIDLPFRFPTEIRIRPEHFFDKIAGAIGFDDIDFESSEFSRKFHVKSKNRKLAYDIIHSRMMELLLEHRSIKPTIELDHRFLCIYRSGRLKAQDYEKWLDFTERFYAHFPEFVTQALQSQNKPTRL